MPLQSRLASKPHCAGRIINSMVRPSQERAVKAEQVERALDPVTPKGDKPLLFRPFFDMASGFWLGETRRQAWLLTGGVLLFVLLNLGAALAVNRWNRYFFDALERKDFAAFASGIGIILGLVLFSAAVSVALVHCRMRLQLRWRQWLTRISPKGGSRAAASISSTSSAARLPIPNFVSPTTRGSRSSRWSTSRSGFATPCSPRSPSRASSGRRGGSISIGGWTVPGYMVIAALIYSGLISAGMVVIGRPLVDAVEAEERRRGEAALRAYPRARTGGEHRVDRRRRRRAGSPDRDLPRPRRALAQGHHAAGAHDMGAERKRSARPDHPAPSRRAKISIRRDEPGHADAGRSGLRSGPDRAELARRQFNQTGRVVRLGAARRWL